MIRAVKMVEISENKDKQAVRLSKDELELIVNDLVNKVPFNYEIELDISVGAKTDMIAFIFYSDLVDNKENTETVIKFTEVFLKVFEKMLHFTTTMYHYLPLPDTITTDIDKENEQTLLEY